MCTIITQARRPLFGRHWVTSIGSDSDVAKITRVVGCMNEFPAQFISSKRWAHARATCCYQGSVYPTGWTTKESRWHHTKLLKSLPSHCVTSILGGGEEGWSKISKISSIFCRRWNVIVSLTNISKIRGLIWLRLDMNICRRHKYIVYAPNVIIYNNNL